MANRATGVADRQAVPTVVRCAVALAFMIASSGDAPADDDSPPPAARRSQQELMAERGFVRYEGAWRTVQEIELIERAQRTNVAQKEWVVRLERLRRQCDRQGTADRAAEEIRGISDPFAVPALAAAVAKEESFRVRRLYVEALSRIRSAEAGAALAAVAVDHPDPETRIAAVERLVVVRRRGGRRQRGAVGDPDRRADAEWRRPRVLGSMPRRDG